MEVPWKPLGGVFLALEGVLEAFWRPLGGVREGPGFWAASDRPPGTPGGNFYVFFLVFTRFFEEPGLHWNGKRVTLESVVGTC